MPGCVLCEPGVIEVRSKPVFFMHATMKFVKVAKIYGAHFCPKNSLVSV